MNQHINNPQTPISTLHSIAIALMSMIYSLPAYAEPETALPEVSVSATADSQEERRISSAGKLIIDRNELEAMDASTVSELLRKLPAAGMFSEPDAGPPARRGQNRGPSRNMPQILVDGQPLAGGDRNPSTVLRLPVEMIERIEIIRNSTPEFSVSSPAGVINIIMRDVPPKATRNGKATQGSSDGQQSLRLDGQLGNTINNVGYLLSGSAAYRPLVGSRQSALTTFSQGTAIVVNEATSQEGDDTSFSFAPRLTLKLAPGQQLTISPMLNYSEDSREVSTQRSNGSINQELDASESQRATARVMTDWKQLGAQGAETSVRFLLQAENENGDKNTYATQSNGMTNTTTEQTTRIEYEQLLELRGKRLWLERHLFTATLEGRNKDSRDEQHKQGTAPTNNQIDISEQRYVFWLQDEWQMHEQHLLTYGFRLQRTVSEIDDQQNGIINQEGSTFDPSLHYLWQPNEQWNTRISIAQLERSPQSRELSPIVRTGNGVNTSGNPDRTGNSSLKTEKQQSIELGVEHFLAQKAGTVGLSVFERHVVDYVQRLTLLENGRWIERPYNVGDSRVRGLIFDAKAQLKALNLADMTIRGNYAYTTNKILTPYANLGAGEGTRQSANLGADYNWTALKLTIGVSGSYTSPVDRESSATVTQVQGAQKTVDLFASYKINRQFNMRLVVQNLTATDRVDELQEYDAQGQLLREERDKTSGLATVSLSVDGRW